MDFAQLNDPIELPSNSGRKCVWLRGLRAVGERFIADVELTTEEFDLDGDTGFEEFEGASTGLIGKEDLEEAAAALNPGTSAAVLLWENRWAAPVAAALRRSGGQLVASGRLPVQAILAALEAAEANS